jgi:hypothetical protein
MRDWIYKSMRAFKRDFPGKPIIPITWHQNQASMLDFYPSDVWKAHLEAFATAGCTEIAMWGADTLPHLPAWDDKFPWWNATNEVRLNLLVADLKANYVKCRQASIDLETKQGDLTKTKQALTSLIENGYPIGN